MGFFARLIAKFHKKPTLGLALGSGGAKGMAHLGVLKAFEEEGISFSVVTGASIGGIVGALYAKGYTSADMTGIIEGLNRREFSKNLRPFADMAFAENFLKQYLDGDFSSLPIPFAVWATDAESGGGVALKEGELARALTASAAIPPFFRGVEIEGRKYYDGAFTNAIPADLCKELGADFVVGVDLSAFTRLDEEKGIFARFVDTAARVLTPVSYAGDSKTRGYEAADVMLRPNLYNFRATDIDPAAMDEMFSIGYREAKEQMPHIREAIASFRKKKEKKR